ncbi:MAG: efflux RND transporter periplasmic adaptor subunit [Kiritimatiellae bacterium]|nr:efflux RND transporter periplasmic adaptor subunit [Kiritimatiellia bacterium]
MKKNTHIQLMITGVALWMWTSGSSFAAENHPHDSHEEHPHTSYEHVDHNNAPRRIPVTQEQVKRLGIKIAYAVRGSVHREIRVPGEIKINSDRVAHVVPRAKGIVREVKKTLGDRVQTNDVLAWIESDELANAKLNFYEKKSEVGCCAIKLPRAKAIFENVIKLIALLKTEATSEAIHKLDSLEMGAYRGQLLSAYTAFLAARTTYEQEARLHDKKISSDRERLIAETTLRQTQAHFAAAMDTARYETLIAYTEAIQENQLAGFNASAAEKQLRLKGADDEAVKKVEALIPETTSLEPCVCDDPNCGKDPLAPVADTLGKDRRFAWYALRAPFNGTLIKKHIVMGESIDESAEVFTIADLTSVWVDLAISQDAIGSIQEEQLVTIYLPDGSTTKTTITFISPIVASDTRTALARAIVRNSEEKLRPGTFVDAAILIPSREEAVIVPEASVQLVNDHPCVFVWGKADFELREVTTGITDGKTIEILKGLHVGEKVATVNAFHLKAEYIKSAAGERGAHAGHSH